MCPLTAKDWAKQNAWTILDTSWPDNFLATWQAWRADPLRPRMLHYVVLLEPPAAPAAAGNLATSAAIPPALVHALQQACADLAPGFNRVLLDQGQVSLTLCWGERKDMLAQQAFAADTVFLHAQPWDEWQLKQLAQRCRRGTRLYAAALAPEAMALFTDAGFRWEPSPATVVPTACTAMGTFDPSWPIANSRNTRPSKPAAIARCAVVGAGISGATVAHALALRGWQVTVLDPHAAPAGGASGLPAGLVAPQRSADNDARSRISRSGVRLMLHWARQCLVHQQDWALSGVQEHKRADLKSATPATHWHAQAAWIKPAALVRALLAHPGITFRGLAMVRALRWQNEAWVLLDATGAELGRAEQVVFANALDCVPLLAELAAQQPLHPHAQANLQHLHALHGTVSRGNYGPHTTEEVLRTFPRFPVNGQGSFLPSIPTAQGFEWLLGATYENSATPVPTNAAGHANAQHAANLAKLQQLLPATAAALEPAFRAGAVSAWAGTRCVSHDRMPLVGPLVGGAAPSLWINAAMGSRGLSFSAICAELLVAQLCAEPLPLEARLARSLDVLRARRQPHARQKEPQP